MISNNTVSFFRYSSSNDEYELISSCGAWVFLKKGISGSVKGDANADTLHIRIRRDEIERIETGDFVFVGDFRGEKPPLSECKKITKVSDNNFGSAPHWHIEVGA